jgi:flagellar hook protein FlgE
MLKHEKSEQLADPTKKQNGVDKIMSFSFGIALSGLNANAAALRVVGNNIANANTIGFRSAATTFIDSFASSSGSRLNGAGNSLEIGSGVRIGSIHTNFESGNLNESGSPLHSAIQGNGFFVVRNADGTNGYSRAGDFTVDNAGFLRSANGGTVQGFMAQNGTIASGTPLSSIQLPIGQTIAPQVSTNGTFGMNLNSNTPTGTEFNASMTVYDSRGTARSLSLNFTRLADGTFDVTGTVGGVAAQLDGGSGPTSSPINFSFDANGALTSPTSLSVVPDPIALGGAVLPSVTINLFQVNPDGSQGAPNITSYAAPASAVASTYQDGFGAGELVGVNVDPYGVISGIFSNGETAVVAQYAVATFQSQTGLQRMGNNMFAETNASGQATIGEPGTGGRGTIAGGYLEQSNVNITNEFVELIEAQRGFQSNSRVITTVNQTFQDLLQII